MKNFRRVSSSVEVADEQKLEVVGVGDMTLPTAQDYDWTIELKDVL